MQALDLNDFLLHYRKSGRYVPLPKDVAYRLPTPLQRLLGAARSRPQAIVKLASKLKSADSICHAVEYISRDDTRELRNQDNDVVNGLTEGRAIARAWTEDKLKRKDALRAVHLIFSSPKHTRPGQNYDAARALCRDVFGEHEYVLAQHDDTPNLHTHVILKNISLRGKGRTWRKAQLKTLRDAWAYHQQQQGIDVTSSYRSERAAYTPGLSMPQVKARARGEALYHEQQDEQYDNRTQAWITRQLEQAHQVLLRHAELQQLLRKSNDARARDYLRDNARFMDELVARSRDHVETFRPGRMPDWIRAYRPEAPEDEVAFSR